MRKKHKILIVEDETVDRQFMTQLLENKGFTVIISENGKQALNMLTNDPEINLVITDIKMPEMDGRELTLAIRSQLNKTEIPILIVSGAVGPKFIYDLLGDGVTAFIPKPIDSTTLLEYVHRYLMN